MRYRPVPLPRPAPLPDNPYHRIFTKDRRFEELAAARGEKNKKELSQTKNRHRLLSDACFLLTATVGHCPAGRDEVRTVPTRCGRAAHRQPLKEGEKQNASQRPERILSNTVPPLY